MPPELRTPSETLALVDQTRQTMLQIASTLEELSPDDVVAFVRMLVDGEGRKSAAATSARATAALEGLAAQLAVVVELLGGRQWTATEPVTFLSYELPTFELGQVLVGERSPG